MTKKKRFRYMTGLLLTCSFFMVGCQTSKQVQESKKAPKVVKKVEKAKSEVKNKSTRKVAGIDEPTSDGFLLTDDSQIESRTDQGIVVKHGSHHHFFFYSDLKGTKWEHLIPEDYDANVTTSPSHTQVSTSSLSVHSEDNYIFNPSDIVAEDAHGYTVRHNDHYHYIPKSSLSGTPLHLGHHLPTAPEVLYVDGKIPGIDSRTSDGFLFDGTDISGITATGILVKHGSHLHPISFEALKNSKWAYLLDRYQSNTTDNKVVENKYDKDYLDKLTYLAKELHLAPEKIKTVLVDGQVGFEYPHGDHTHVVLLSAIDMSRPFENVEDADITTEEGETLEERKERIIQEYMKRFNVKREAITVEGNYMSVRHGDHAHVYKIDPSLPDDPERDVKTETTTLEDEKDFLYGPFYTEGSMENLTRKGVYQKYQPQGLQNIKNFVLLTFSTNSEHGDLLVNGQKTKRVYYLVRKDLNWEDLGITYPDTVKEDNRILGKWRSELPTSGQMAREHKAFYIDFDRTKKAPRKNVYGPNEAIDDLDLKDYLPIKYSVLENGRLKLGDVVQGGFTYLVNPTLTWKEARQQGLVEPEAIANDRYEFIEFRETRLGGDKEDDKVSVTTSLAVFGTTASYIGPYLAKNPENPTDVNDPSRHPNYYWHNPKHYVAVGFKAEEGGEVISRAGRGQTAVYLIRKGLSLSEAGIFTPWVQALPGYTREHDKPILSDEEYVRPVTEDTVYKITFDKIKEENTPSSSSNDDWLPGDDLSDKPDTAEPSTSSGSWLDEFLGDGTTTSTDDDWLPGDDLPSPPLPTENPQSSGSWLDEFLSDEPTADDTNHTHDVITAS